MVMMTTNVLISTIADYEETLQNVYIIVFVTQCDIIFLDNDDEKEEKEEKIL